MIVYADFILLTYGDLMKEILVFCCFMLSFFCHPCEVYLLVLVHLDLEAIFVLLTVV